MEGISNSHESSESLEYEPSIEVIHRLLNLSENSFISFKDRLQNNQGHLRIWVHPLYTQQWPGTVKGRLGDADITEVQNNLRTTFLKTASSVASNQNSSPMVVYEAVKKIEETKSLIADNLNCDVAELEDKGIIFIPTESSSPALDQESMIESLKSGNENDQDEAERLVRFRKAVNDYVNLSEQQRKYVHEQIPGLAKDPYYMMSEEEKSLYLDIIEKQRAEMKPVMDRYRQARQGEYLQGGKFVNSVYRALGLESALVSGAYLEVGENCKTKEPELKACAGGVVKLLREEGYPVDISKNIWPPKELIREAGFEVKQTGGQL